MPRRLRMIAARRTTIMMAMRQARSLFNGGVMSKLRYSLRAVLAVGVVLAAAAAAQSYPSRQIRMVVGYGAGGGADSLIRALAPELSALLGQQVVVDNRPGGGSVIGTQTRARRSRYKRPRAAKFQLRSAASLPSRGWPKQGGCGRLPLPVPRAIR